MFHTMCNFASFQASIHLSSNVTGKDNSSVSVQKSRDRFSLIFMLAATLCDDKSPVYGILHAKEYHDCGVDSLRCIFPLLLLDQAWCHPAYLTGAASCLSSQSGRSQ